MGYHHVPIAEDKHKTAFPSRLGLLQYTAMPFGLTNAPATFQRLMERVLAHMNRKDCLVYIDDVLIWSKSFEEHLRKLEQVFQAFEKAGLRIKPRKCHICCKSVLYFGHLLSSDGIRVDPARVKAIREMPAPSKAKSIESFLGLVNYYRRFVRNLSEIEAPLRDVISNATFVWTEEAQPSFDEIKKFIARDLILAYPDPTALLVVDRDASDVGLGSIISQIGSDGTEHPIAYASRVLAPSEKKLSVMEREWLAVVWAITEQFHCYLYCSKFVVQTDNRPLSWMRTLTRPAPRIARWILKLQEYDFVIVHRPGSSNLNAGTLSRLPLNAVLVQSDGSKVELLNRQMVDPECAMLIQALKIGTPEDKFEFLPVQRLLLSNQRIRN